VLVFDCVLAIRSEIRKQKRISDLVRSKTFFRTLRSVKSSPRYELNYNHVSR